MKYFLVFNFLPHPSNQADLDTIELSNLNRQFLFRRRHIGKFKATIAAEAVMAMNPKSKVVPHVGNIMDTNQFPVAFFQKFDIVLNALDNLSRSGDSKIVLIKSFTRREAICEQHVPSLEKTVD